MIESLVEYKDVIIHVVGPMLLTFLFAKLYAGVVEYILYAVYGMALSVEVAQLDLWLSYNGYNWTVFLNYDWLDTALDLSATTVGIFIAFAVLCLRIRIK